MIFSLPASRAVSSTSTFLLAPGAQVAEAMRSRGAGLAARRHEVDFHVLGDAGAGIREQQAIDLRLAEEHFVGTGDLHLQLRFLDFDDRVRADRGVGPRDAQFERTAFVRNQAERQRFGGLRLEPLDLPFERAGRFAVAALGLADVAARGGRVDGFDAFGNANRRHKVVGGCRAVVSQPQVVTGFATDRDLLRAFHVGDDHRCAVGDEDAGGVRPGIIGGCLAVY